MSVPTYEGTGHAYHNYVDDQVQAPAFEPQAPHVRSLVYTEENG